MALLLIEGFDLYNNVNPDFSRQWQFSGSTGVFVTSPVRTGRGSYFANNAPDSIWRIFTPAEEHATVIVGMAFFRTFFDDSETITLMSDNNSTSHVSVNVDSNGGVRVTRGGRGGTTLGFTPSGLIPINTWHYIEVLVTLSDTVGVVTLNVDGIQRINVTNVDTKNAGTKTVFDTVRIGQISSGGSADIYIDDVYICNGAGTTNNNLMGECRVRTLYPNGNGANSVGLGSDGNNTNNYQLVLDQTPSSGSAAYVDLVHTGDEDTYTFDDVPDITGNVIGMQTTTYAMKTDSGVRQLAHVARTGSGGVPGPFLTDPCEDYTTAPWTITGFTPTIVTGHTGNGFSITNGSSGSRISYDIPTDQQNDKLVLGAWMNFVSGSVYASLTPAITFRSDAGATEHLRVLFDYTGYISVFRGTGASVGIAGPGAYTPGTWQYFEISVGLGDLNGYVVMKVNGSIILTATNVDTRNAGTKSVFDQVGFYSISGPGITTPYLVDDVTLGAGLAPNEYLSADFPPGTSFGWQLARWETNPITALPWTRNEVNAAEFGVRAR